MPSKEEVKAKARMFLEVVRQQVQEHGNTKVMQTGTWWSAAKPGDSKVVVSSPGSTSFSQFGSHERVVFNSYGVNTLYQTQLRDNDFPEQHELWAAISAAGIEDSWISYGFLLPLIHEWCLLPEPLDLNQPAVEDLLKMFATAVVEHQSITTYRDAIIDIEVDPVFRTIG